MPQPLLEGEYVEPAADTEELREEISRLEGELRKARMEINKARADNTNYESAIKSLRQQLSPLHRALRAVFGEINLVAGEDAPSTNGVSSPAPQSSSANKAWEAWKQKLPGFPSRMIDALLEHGELSVSQLVVAAQCPRKTTIYDAASKLNKLGLIRKNGDKYSLKEL